MICRVRACPEPPFLGAVCRQHRRCLRCIGGQMFLDRTGHPEVIRCLACGHEAPLKPRTCQWCQQQLATEDERARGLCGKHQRQHDEAFEPARPGRERRAVGV